MLFLNPLLIVYMHVYIHSYCTYVSVFIPVQLLQVLIALVAGEDALRFESLSDQVIVAKAIAVLRSIFGDTAVPEVGL